MNRRLLFRISCSLLAALFIFCLAGGLRTSAAGEVTLSAAVTAEEPAHAAKALCTYCGGTGIDCSNEDCVNGYVYSDSRFAFSFWALLPPILAIGLALITKEVYSSLFLGILLGCLLNSNFHPVDAFDTLINSALVSAIADNAGIFLFLVLLGITVALLNKSGASAAFGRWAETHIHSRVGAQLATFFLGILIFVDDYFNCLTVGSVMQPITDNHKISRAKLAYLIDATAAPVCMIAPISSWAAAVTGVVADDHGIELFVKAIPWNYYSLLTIVFILGLVFMKFDYGPMKLHEKNAQEKNDLFTVGEHINEAMAQEAHSDRGRVIDLILPILTLIGFCVLALIYVGGFFDPSGSNYHDFIHAFSDTDAFVALPLGSITALLISIIYYFCRKLVSFQDAMKCVPQGFINMVPAITILVFANGLKNVVNGCLGARYFVGNLMLNASGSLMGLLPAVIFIVGCVLSFATGTSWGTFGILIPIVSVMFDPAETLFYIGIGACLAGAVFGDHCSPISDTTIMASAGGMCDHVNHVTTQIPYAATVGGICFVNYLLAGFIKNAVVCIVIGTVIVLAALFILKKLEAKKKAA